MRRGGSVSTAIGVAVALLVVLLAAPPAAAGVTVTPNVPKLPAGALPHMPYVDWVGKKIVDGNRKVSIAGLQKNVHSMHKVDGGYLLLRHDVDDNWDLVFVSTAGARRVIVPYVHLPTWPPLRDGNMLAVSGSGDKVVVNTATGGGYRSPYKDTRVISLPAGQVLQNKSDFGGGGRPDLLAYGTDRVLLTAHEPGSSSYPDTKWWTPATGAVTAIRENTDGLAADLSAWQWAVRPEGGDYTAHVRGIPPATEPDWPAVAEGSEPTFGSWSLDDKKIAGHNGWNVDNEEEANAYIVHRASDGARLLSVWGNQIVRIEWETNSALLMRTRIKGTRTYQLIRCTLSGSCSRVGPSTRYYHGGIIPVTRRNS
jgi:hypothetical protein